MHFTFTVVGGLLFIGSGLLTGRMRHVLLLLPGKTMGIFGAFLLFTSWYVYPVYQKQSDLIAFHRIGPVDRKDASCPASLAWKDDGHIRRVLALHVVVRLPSLSKAIRSDCFS